MVFLTSGASATERVLTRDICNVVLFELSITGQRESGFAYKIPRLQLSVRVLQLKER